MKIIALEEHFTTPELHEALMQVQGKYRDDNYTEPKPQWLTDKLLDLGEGRLKDMDAAGIDKMVLSTSSPGVQGLMPDKAVPLARRANDALAAAVKAHPDRFAGFATLPLADPKASVEELQRCIQELGFCGVLTNGRTFDKYLDHADFFPVLQKMEELNVPLYIHPQIAPREVRALYYDGFDRDISLRIATSGFGWHYETGIAAVRLILAGVFDKLPGLQIILGHWGEMMAFYLERIDSISPQTKGRLRKTVANYFRDNFYLTGSGIYVTAYLMQSIGIMGVDRILYATDYPYVFEPDGKARKFLEQAPLTVDQKEKIAHGNAERLMKLN